MKWAITYCFICDIVSVCHPESQACNTMGQSITDIAWAVDTGLIRSFACKLTRSQPETHFHPIYICIEHACFIIDAFAYIHRFYF